MSFKRHLFDIVTLPIRIGMRHANAFTARLALACQPVFNAAQKEGPALLFHCPSPVTLWRAKTLFSKEPDTIEWMNSFSPSTILFDVGANVGMYSLYAASRGVKVYAFEPESQNFALLNRNIELNRAFDRVLAYNFALGDQSRLEVLQVSSTEVGNALHAVGERPNNYSITNRTFRQGVACFSLDQLVYQFGLPTPSHLKIDVDGIEPEIVAGALKLLSDQRLRGLLVELDEDDARHQALVPTIEALGLKLISKKASPLAAGTRFERVCNHIFSRV